MKTYLLLFGLLLMMPSPTWSQKWAEKGHKQFQELAFGDAIVSFEKAVQNGKGNPKIYAELADAYYFNANYQASAKWYRLLFKESKQQLFLHYFRYAQVLKSTDKDEQAALLWEEMKSLFPKKMATFVVLEAEKSITFSTNNPARFTIKNAPFNSDASDFGPSYFGNQIMFASTRDTGSVFKRSHSWTNQSFTDLYLSDSEGLESKPIRFSKALNSKFNESTAILTKDGLTLYFTRNNFQNKKLGTDENQTTLLKIYKAEKDGGNWKVIGALPFCKDTFNVAHPALSPDEKTLYFASDQPGGFGASDVYKVEVHSDGTFGTPENLGSSVNSIGRDTYPFISQNTDLYFASERPEGFGGLDVYVARCDANQKYYQPQNVGQPINSRMDDFGFIFNEQNRTGYFTSNRPGGIGLDDIYSFVELVPLPCETSLTGTIVLLNAGESTSKVTVTLLDANTTVIASTNPEANGQFAFDVDCQKRYTIEARFQDYTTQQIQVEAKNYETNTVGNIVLEKEQVQFQIGDDLAKRLKLQPIYFDLDKSNIRPDAALELMQIKSVLENYPTLSIEIRSHTDSRDTFENNQLLSQQRATSTLNWLVENGIQASRLKGAGFGETKLLNSCSDNIPCTEEQHQQNRRSEFIVTGL